MPEYHRIDERNRADVTVFRNSGVAEKVRGKALSKLQVDYGVYTPFRQVFPSSRGSAPQTLCQYGFLNPYWPLKKRNPLFEPFF